MGQIDTPTPTTQDQGASMNEEKEKNRSEELGMTTKPEEKLAIQTLVNFLESTTPPSQALYRPSIEDISL